MNSDEVIKSPLRLLEVLAQGFREVTDQTDAAVGVPTDDYDRGYRDGIRKITNSLEQLILAAREGEMSDGRQ